MRDNFIGYLTLIDDNGDSKEDLQLPFNIDCKKH